MIKTIELLEEKNMYLEKFLGLNRERLDSLSRGDFSNLESFREDRESILNILKHLDSLVESRTLRLDSKDVDDSYKGRVQGLLNRKDSLVRAILSQDLDIMQIIEKAKSEIITELRNTRSGRKTISSYKSFNPKETLDEKA